MLGRRAGILGLVCGAGLMRAAAGGVAVPPIRLDIPVDAGRVHAAVPVTLALTAPDGDGKVGIEGRADLRSLDAQLARLLGAALGPRPECKLQVDLRRAWLSVAGAQRVRLDVSGRVMQPLCGKLREVLGGPLAGPSSAASAAVELRLLADAEGRPVVFVERVQMGTGRRELDLLLRAWRPPEEVRADLQAQLDEALAQWPPPLLAGFAPRLRSLAIEQAANGALSVTFRGSFKAGWAEWLGLLSRLGTRG